MKVFCEGGKGHNQGRRASCSLSRPGHAVRRAGFSLLELLITIAIMGIVMTISTLSFNSWQTKNKIESQTRQMYADLADARTRAFTQKKVHGIVFQPNSYVMKSYSSEIEYKYASDPVSNGIVVASKPLNYGITKTNTTTVFTDTNSSILFDITGFTTSATGFTVVVNPVSAAPSVNCLVISVARENMGKWNATTSKCEIK